MKTQQRIQERLEAVRYDLREANSRWNRALSHSAADRRHLVELETKISVLEWVLGIN